MLQATPVGNVGIAKFVARCAALVGLLLTFAVPSQAQIDLAGQWSPRFHEDQFERIEGPSIGDYLGIPLNADARLRADSWDAALWTVPEHQCIPHPATYAWRGPANVYISQDLDPRDPVRQLRSITIFGLYGDAPRTIWMDGRAAPPEGTAHTWAGFSVGRWDGETLVIETSRIKAGYLRRNGVPHSDQATIVEHIFRDGDVLTVLAIRTDPVYLDAPYVQTTNFVLNPVQRPFPAGRCDPVTEIAGRTDGYIPHHLPGTNAALATFPIEAGVPSAAARGGAATMYPEYRACLATAPAGTLPEACK